MHVRLSGGDPLSDVLRDLSIRGVGYARCELTAPWGLVFPTDAVARVHVVVEGPCWLRVGRAWTELAVGDVVLLPRGAGHAIADRRRGRGTRFDAIAPQVVGDRSYRLTTGGGGARTLLACCAVELAAPALSPVLALMPAVLRVERSATLDPMLPALLDAMADEVSRERIGGATILSRLADVVIARLIRTWVESRRGDTTGWLAAIRDPHVGRALAAIHRDPGAAWTVASLARQVAVSRSVFAERFAAVVGVSPGRYLTRWRMHVASGWLRDHRLTVAETAARVGYDSEASFSRAFKRDVGVPPSTLRRHYRGLRATQMSRLPGPPA